MLPGAKEGEREVPFPRAMMRRPNNMRLTGSTEKANKLIERKENEDMFNMLRGDPLVNPIKLVENILESYGRKNTQDYINPEIGQLMQALEENPELMQALTQAAQQFFQAQEEGGTEGGAV